MSQPACEALLQIASYLTRVVLTHISPRSRRKTAISLSQEKGFSGAVRIVLGLNTSMVPKRCGEISESIQTSRVVPSDTIATSHM